MSIDREQIERTATLARLSLNAAEMEEITARLNGILALVDQMQALDTTEVKPMGHPLDAVQVLRADEVEPIDDPVARRAAFQAIAPRTEDGLYLVPKVIE